MRRQEIQLLAKVRRGDVAARCEVGRGYLTGTDGFPRHIATGIEYLTHESVKSDARAWQILSECLSLEEILTRQQLGALERAAACGNAAAQCKLGVWLCVRRGVASAGMSWLEASSNSGHAGARHALETLRAGSKSHIDPAVALSGVEGTDAFRLTMIAARAALDADDFVQLARCARNAVHLSEASTSEVSELVVAAVMLAEARGESLPGISPMRIEECLELHVRRGDRNAGHLLGRALCGLPCGPFAATDLAGSINVRKGSALLLRAADAGCDDAWLHLYRLTSDLRSSVSNPQMARFFLEKAAASGRPEAQRRLGALILREAVSIEQTEQAITWLHKAMGQGDEYAAELLRSLVLPVSGSDTEARAAIDNVRREDPWLAMRLQLSRRFGLTKLEALCVDPAEGLRSWGLVVSRNPFISQTRLSAPRAIPAVCSEALNDLRNAATLFEQVRQSAAAPEGDLRSRTWRQRRAFDRHGLDAEMFFSNATSMTLEALRQGPKWAYRARKPLLMALAGQADIARPTTSTTGAAPAAGTTPLRVD